MPESPLPEVAAFQAFERGRIWAFANTVITAMSVRGCVIMADSQPDYRAALRRTEAVFRGTVLQVVELSVPTIPPHDGSFLPIRMVVFDADVTWAGVRSRRVMVFTGFGSSDCGYAFKVGHAYIVWADRDDWRTPEELHTGLCKNTVAVEDADEQLRQLGKPRMVKK